MGLILRWAALAAWLAQAQLMRLARRLKSTPALRTGCSAIKRAERRDLGQPEAAAARRGWQQRGAENSLGAPPLLAGATLPIMKGAQKNPAASELVNIPGYLLLDNGVPVKVGNEVIGALGVAGAPGGNLNDQCADAALASVQEQLK